MRHVDAVQGHAAGATERTKLGYPCICGFPRDIQQNISGFCLLVGGFWLNLNHTFHVFHALTAKINSSLLISHQCL